ncbi:transposase [Mycobacteroides abscessus]|uniref:transposase n=1 Tax=Mycobacteroides abscessus TaxID=36809 RepID=UPI001EEE3A30|nr:transposase [Mycobacteroides abscessus]
MPTTAAGYADFLVWARAHGPIHTVGIEGSGHYGAGLARYLRTEGVSIREVGHPNRQRRARYGKTDTLDARGAAAIVLAGQDSGQPKDADGDIEMLRVLKVTRTSAVNAKSIAITTMQDLLVTAPPMVREQFTGLSSRRLITACAQLDVNEIPCTPTESVYLALRYLAIRYQQLAAEATALEHQIHRLTIQACPALLSLHGVGPECAATLLIALGDNKHRITSEAAFAKLCGVSPVEASSCQTIRHRLNRGGNRQANKTLHTVITVRLRRHQPTRDHLARRSAEGKTKREAIRCLKRYLAREIYNTVLPAQTRQKTCQQ